MLINNPDALKSWLVVVLEPLCDADSSALARYVLALLKKDKPEKELKKVMIEQLDVFLGEETRPFVERLFDAISSEEYLTTPVLVPANKISDTEISAATIGDVETNVIKTEISQEPSSSEAKASDTPLSSAYADKIQTPPIDESKTKDMHSSGGSNNNTSIQKPSDASERSTAHYPTVKTEPLPAAALSSHHQSHVRSASPPARTNADKENQPRESRRRRASLRPRSRSRSRSASNERLSRRSRSRDRRANEREKNQRQFRNKSPPSSIDMRSSHDRRRGGDRRRIGGSNVGGDERSPRFGGSGGEGGGRKTGRSNRSNTRSRSPSLDRDGRGKASPGVSRNTRNSPDRHSSSHHMHAHLSHESGKRQRCRDFDEKGYCVRGETCPWDHGVNPVVFEDINNSALISMSLREYNPDAPDLWTRSATTAGGMVPTALMAGGAANNSINPFTGVARPMVGPGTAVGFSHMGVVGGDKAPNGSAGALTPGDYARNAASAAGGFRAAAPMMPFPFNPAAVTTPLQRELIPIPVVDAGAGGDVGAMQPPGSKRRFELEDSVAIADGPAKRKVPLNSRLGPRLPNIQNNCSLELRKVPRGLNTIAHLNNHFAKFGKIVNIQISYDGDPEAAIVTFSTHAEANVAYRSTEAVLNNRFIKVFWHNQELGGAPNDMQPVSGRKNSQYHLNNVPAVPTPAADSAKISNTNTAVTSQSSAPAIAAGVNATSQTTDGAAGVAGANATVAATHVPPTSLRLKNNAPRALTPGASNAIRKKQEEQAKAVVQLANGLRKRKQELLQSYVKQMKSALELVERCEPSDPQRSKTLETIKVLQETIDKLRKEIAAEQEQMQAQIQNQHPAQPPLKKTKEQQKKELLDIELELFAQQQEGNDTTSIQKRLEELQRSLGIPPGSGAIGVTGSPASGRAPHFGAAGVGGNRPSPRAGRPTFPEGSTRVDRRPKTIVVTGFTSEEADFVLGHFKHFGEITKHDVDKEIPQLILSYSTRINAEQAILRGKIFKDKRLQITWAPVIPLAANPTSDCKAVQPDDKANDPTKAAKTPANSNEKSSIDNEAITTDTLPELRLEDEEEDEESEDRSWRR